MLIVPVLNIAIWMIVLAFIERGYKLELELNPGHMIGYHIKHYPNVSLMTSCNQVKEILFSSKMRVDFVPVESAVSMIIISVVFWNGGYPDGVKAHTLNVI